MLLLAIVVLNVVAGSAERGQIFESVFGKAIWSPSDTHRV